ncbi:MAG: hypothetical protein JWO25_2880 [Alphaproteobacteria bacterium]|nr:hypothetical protein [Alphaproteobacteria bacterium]MDB5720651.1 hypothetical protein [Alphaproteobacteria bacterium]
MMKLLLAAAALLSASPGLAQQAAGPAEPAEPKVNQLIIYGDDKCPPSTEDVINVCARMSERERFRIPSSLRSDPNDPANQAWGTRASALEYVGRTGPQSCSPVGPGGSTGCFSQIVREARAERNSADTINWNSLVDQARKERLSKIDAQAKAIDDASPPPK